MNWKLSINTWTTKMFNRSMVNVYKVWPDGVVIHYHQTHEYRGDRYVLIEAKNPEEALLIAKAKGIVSE